MVEYTKENPPVVSRNNAEVALSEATFGKTSPLKGQKFWTLEITAANREQARTFVGEDVVDNVVTRFLRRVGIDIFTDEKNKNTDGTINWDAVLSDWAEFDTGSATLKELREQLDELADEQMAIAEKIDEEELLDDNGEPKADKQARFNELSLQSKELSNKARPLKKSIKAITEKYAAIAAKRAASKEATA